MFKFTSILILFLWAIMKVDGVTLQSVSDDELLELIKDREKLIVLFSKDNCKSCDILERLVESLQDDFRKHLEAISVKAMNSHMAKLYNPAKEPALVFFRHGVPLLYSGESDENEIYGYFEKNQAPAVKELTDKIFEHITQAATGATTGDWFVMFYGASCVECQRLHAVWEGVGATLKNRINVARMDATLAGENTAKRFQVTKLPAFLFRPSMEDEDLLLFLLTMQAVGLTLFTAWKVNKRKRWRNRRCFRLGKVYRYNLPKADIKSFVTFAQDWYKNAKGEPVALLASPFDETVDWCVVTLKALIAYALEVLSQHPWIWQIGVAGFGLVAITALIALMKAGKSRPAKDNKKEKKRK